MKINEIKQKATEFKKLHQNFFVLPNVWNGGSAKIFENQGFKALATTSAGIAYSKGKADGEIITIKTLQNVVKEILEVSTLPLSVDFERGYSNNQTEIYNNAKSLIELGVVGLNIEDGNMVSNPYLDDLDLQIDKIKALVQLKKDTGIDFVINARTCVYWLKIGDEDYRIKEAIKRANSFVMAGADCVFIPGALDKKTVKTLVKNIHAPINIVANPVFNDINELKALGVKRLSIGSGAVRAVYANLIDISNDLHHNQRINSMLNNNFSYQKANEYFK